MTDKKNNLAGIGDPYWYEWSVGLLYALDMLNPDSNIKSVVLQASNLQGLDDVVINFNNGESECVQIKHTRENDSLTFSDLIRAEKGVSYLSQFSADWIKSLSSGYKNSKAVLFTNRKIGQQKYTVKQENKEDYERPSLEAFWPYVKQKVTTSSKLNEIIIDKKWEVAWRELLNELSPLTNDDQKLIFLRNFEIKTNQQDLDEIIESIAIKLSKYFKIDVRLAVQLHQNLCYALMKWTTTLRNSEEIFLEDLLEALALSSDNFKGIHDIPTNEPFFSSRISFVESIEEYLGTRISPIVFLYGEPGSGKTNIVSHLTNKLDSVITLRFYAFKPLVANDLYISADKGVSEPKALWGDLLIQLRELLKGRLAKYHVPVSNQLLDSVDHLRSEVLRLSVALSNELGKKTVIAIDGIDHAARSGESNTFLETLVPPEGVPDEVCFFIVGQPINEYKAYPDWFSSDLVTKIEVPKLNQEDIRQLYHNEDTMIPDEQIDVAVKIIQEKAKGNTLSTIFAIYEAKKCNTVEELEARLNNKQISSGINSYYEYIWKAALDNIPSNFFYVDYVLAGVLSLINKKISPEMVMNIYQDPALNGNIWKRILQKLYPIVIEEDNEFRVFHNDVRVYLEKYLKRNLANFIEVSGKIADFYMFKSEDKFSKHEQVFTLLKYAKREEEFINIFTKEYVIEAISIERPMEELIEQLEMTLNSSLELSDYQNYIDFSCGVATLFQFIQSLQWTNKQYVPAVDLPLVLQSEKKVVHKRLLTKEELLRVFKEVQLLIDHDKINRAKNIMQRWLQTLAPFELIDILIENDEITLESIEKQLDDDLILVLEQWGSICQYTNINFEKVDQIDEFSDFQKEVLAYFAKGWLKEGSYFSENESVLRTISELQLYFTSDIESFILSLIDSNNIDMVLHLTEDIKKQNYSDSFKIKLAIWAILNGKQEKYVDLIAEIKEASFEFLPSSHSYDRDTFLFYTFISFILAYKNHSKNEIIDSFLNYYKEGKLTKIDMEYWIARSLLLVSINLGYMYNKLHDTDNSEISIEEYERCINILLDERDLHARFKVNGYEVERFFLSEYINISTFLDEKFHNSLFNLIVDRAKKYNNLRHVNIYWEFLKENDQIDILEDLYTYWMSDQGLVWHEEISEMTEIASNFIYKALEIGWIERAEEAKNILQLKSIGYTGRKEYSLYNPLKWYEKIDNWSTEYWSTLGIELLNISKNAAELGDNRAAVYVDSLIATSAGKQGPELLWTYAELNEEWDEYWINRIFDGVINSLESSYFTEEELITLWTVANKIYYTYESTDPYDRQNILNTVYITDIKEAILEAAKRLEYLELDTKLKEIALYAYSLDRKSRKESSYIIPSRWFDQDLDNNRYISNFVFKIKNMTCDEAIKYLYEEFSHNRSSFRWDFIIKIIEKIETEQSDEINNYVPLMLDLLLKRDGAYNWEFDGAYKAYEAIFPYLEENHIKKTLENIVKGYFNLKNDTIESKLYYIANDLEHFTYCYYQTLPDVNSVYALQKILEMHILWLTGNGAIPLKKHYVLKNEGELPNSWTEFFIKLEEKIGI